MSTISTKETPTSFSRTRLLIITIVGLVLLSIALIFIVNIVTKQNENSPFSPPPGLQPAVQIDLSNKAHDAETVAEITLEKTTNFEVFILVKNINTPYFDLSLSGPDDYQARVLHGEDFRTDSIGASALQEFTLPPGKYRLVLTAAQSPGTLTVQWGFR